MKRRYRRGLSELLGALLALVIMAGITASIVLITDKLVSSINSAGTGIIDRIQESALKPLIIPWVDDNKTLHVKVDAPPGMTPLKVIVYFTNGSYKIVDADQGLIKTSGIPVVQNYKCEPVRIGVYTQKGNLFYTDGYYACNPLDLPGAFRLSDGTIIVPEIYKGDKQVNEVSVGQTLYLYGYAITNKTVCNLEMQAATPRGTLAWSIVGETGRLTEGEPRTVVELQNLNLTLRPYTYTNGDTCIIGVLLEDSHGGIIIGSGEVHTSVVLLEINKGDYANETIGYVGPIAHSEIISAQGIATRQIDVVDGVVEGGGSIVINSLAGNTLSFIASSKSDLHKVNYYVIINIDRIAIPATTTSQVNLSLVEPLRYRLWAWEVETGTRGINKALEEIYVAYGNEPKIMLTLDINGTYHVRTPKHVYTELLYKTHTLTLEASKSLRQPLESLVNVTLASVQQPSPQVKSIEYNITSAKRNAPVAPTPQVLEVYTINGDRILIVMLPSPKLITLSGLDANASIQSILAGDTYTINDGTYTKLYLYEVNLERHTIDIVHVRELQNLDLKEQGVYIALALYQQAGYWTPALLVIIAS